MKTEFKMVVVLSALLVTGCGGGGGGDASPPVTEEPPAPPPPGLLMPVESADEFGQSLRDALEGAEYLNSGDNLVFALEEDADGVPIASFDSGAATNRAFSGTTLQESGVDEADLVKYDGEYMYVVAAPAADRYDARVGIFAPEGAETLPTAVRILRTDPATASVEEVGNILLEDERAGSVNGLYLGTFSGAGQLVAVSQNNPFVYWEFFASDYYWQNGNTLIQSFDVADVTAPTAAWSVSLQGSLLASRRIDNTLYVVTRYSPVVPGVISYPQSDDQIEKNRELVAAVSLEDLMPDAIVNNGAPQELVDAGNCYVPNQEYDGLPVPPATGTLVTITAIDLTAPGSLSSTCLNAYTSGFYASTEAIYLTASGSDQTTLIHKFALSSRGAEYRGSGAVPGYIGTRNPSFLMGRARVLCVWSAPPGTIAFSRYRWPMLMQRRQRIPVPVRPSSPKIWEGTGLRSCGSLIQKSRWKLLPACPMKKSRLTSASLAKTSTPCVISAIAVISSLFRL